jgi:hypothetical protein
MMSATDLLELCDDFRNHGRKTDDEVVAWIESDVEEYRSKFLVPPVPQLPPEELLELLPLMGWLIYETTWYSLRRVQAAFESMDAAAREPSERAYGQIHRLANAARRLVWPEYAPRALGAIRAHALAESKRDTEDGYDDAYIVHQEAADRHRSYRDSHGDSADRGRYLLDLDEVLLQLALGETGTACRTAERVIGRWDRFTDGDNDNLDDERQWVQRMYRDLSDAVEIGGRALRTAKRIKDTHQLVYKVDQYRLALVTGYRNPGIMTARAALLALSLAPAMEDLRRQPPGGQTWAQERERLVELFAAAYQELGRPVYDEDGKLVPMVLDHKRALVQLRLHLALLMPGRSLPTEEPFDPCLERDPLDDEAVAQMSGWLAQEPTDGGPNHGSTIGSAILPMFIQSVTALRSLTGDGAGYPAWRIEWFRLGRYSNEPGRMSLVQNAIAVAASRPSLQISTE